jgi:CheY-like chemotaxis protein
MCILVVDDEAITLMVNSSCLEDAGHEVLTALDGVAALRLVDELPSHFTCLVTDYNMPRGMTGAELIECARQNYPAIPMVLATALVGAVSQTWLVQNQVEVLQKPYEPEELVATVARLLEQP